MGDIEYNFNTETLLASTPTEHSIFLWNGQDWNLERSHTYTASTIVAMSGNGGMVPMASGVTKEVPATDPMFLCKYG
jgi:hypothetical protein